MLDSCARLHLGNRLNSYAACGVIGVVVGAVVVTVLAGVSVIGITAEAAILAVVVPQLSFLLALTVARVVTGRERIVMYEMLLAALWGTAAALALVGARVGSGVDLAAVGIMAFLLCGRLGCLRVGCCHGRPHRRGIVYGPAHAEAGFAPYLVGVRLYPVQLLESGGLLLVISFACVVAVRPHQPGELTALSLGLYGVLRFGLELTRGDAARWQVLGLSEAQVFALVISWVLAAAASRAGWMWPLWYLAAAVALTAASLGIVVVVRRYPRGPFALSQAWRLADLAEALGRMAAARTDGIAVVESSGGLRLSGDLDQGLVTLSALDLDARGVRVLARQVAALTHRPIREIRAGQTGNLFHMILKDRIGPC